MKCCKVLQMLCPDTTVQLLLFIVSVLQWRYLQLTTSGSGQVINIFIYQLYFKSFIFNSLLCNLIFTQCMKIHEIAVIMRTYHILPSRMLHCQRFKDTVFTPVVIWLSCSPVEIGCLLSTLSPVKSFLRVQICQTYPVFNLMKQNLIKFLFYFTSFDLC